MIVALNSLKGYLGVPRFLVDVYKNKNVKFSLNIILQC